MDIGILLALQNVREGAPGIVTGFLSALSAIADGPGLVAIVMVVYWCVNKYAGQFTITAFMMGNLVSQFLKNILCIYRPWVREPRITPPESVMEGAGGYSFPSGHATGAMTSLGSFAWLLRKTRVVWSIVLIVIVALIVFARLYLGVHTPQDVLVGVGIGVLAIWLTTRFFRWFENNQDKDVFVVAVVIAISLVTLIIVMVKPYPLDYVDGKLLVDPIEMQKGSFEASGVVIGVMLGWLLERRMVCFSTDTADIDMRGRLIRGVVGVVIVGAVYLIGNALFKAMFGLLWGKLLAMGVLTFVAMFVVPFVFTWLEQTRFVPYAGVPAPRSESSRSAQRSNAKGAGRSDRDRAGRRASSDRNGGRSSSRGSSARRPSSDRSSSRRPSSDSASRSPYDRSRYRAGEARQPQGAEAQPSRPPSREPSPYRELAAGAEYGREPAREPSRDYEPRREPRRELQPVQEAAPARPERSNAALENLPGIGEAPAPTAERMTLPHVQGADAAATPAGLASARPQLSRLDIPSPRDV